MIIHCLFEQSGTFKTAAFNNNVIALDYDIENNFNETDIQIDLFEEINKAFNNSCSIFDDFSTDDIILAFFPCTRFQCRVPLLSRCEEYGNKMCDRQKLIKSMNINNEINYFYSTLCKLCIIAIDRNFKIVIENPYTQPHYLTQFFPLKPDIIDLDRRNNGDHFKKPTQFFFINFKPKQNIIFENLDIIDYYTISKCHGFIRSKISLQYADRFLKHFIL